jgi:4-hydroxythreonine-4-phosphate dehydrogenase
MIAQEAWPAQLLAVADPDLIAARARALGIALRIEPWRPDQPGAPAEPGRLRVRAVPLGTPCRAGCPDAANAEYVLETVRIATEGCMRGEFDAMVTAPVHKGVINDAGYRFSGHTEHLAGLTGTAEPVMMLVAGDLRVALLTTHLPLRDVAGQVTGPRLERTVHIVHDSLQSMFGIVAPRIAVLGLNPHAGESGHLGTEERDIIGPALDRLRAGGLPVIGPLPADSAFTRERLAQFDAVLAMYHDQGLPVLKHVGFGDAVNITLGLPIIRTSVDHGTAVEIAGTGRADPGSLRAALRLAIDLAGQSAKLRPHSRERA